MTIPVPSPDCPHCGHPPVMVFDDGKQMFCGNESCDVLTWNSHQTREELEAHRKEINLSENRD